MIDALIAGKLYGAPKRGTGKNGKTLAEELAGLNVELSTPQADSVMSTK